MALESCEKSTEKYRFLLMRLEGAAAAQEEGFPCLSALLPFRSVVPSGMIHSQLNVERNHRRERCNYDR